MKRIKHIELDYDEVLNWGDRIAPYNYLDTWQKYYDNGVMLPTYSELHLIGRSDRLWIIPNEYILITIVFSDGSFIQYKIKRGHIWDKISNPIGKNNDLETLLPAAPHDINFSLHCLRLASDRNNYKGFRDTNRLFFKMSRCKKLIVNGVKEKNARENLFKAIKNFLAVNNSIGRIIYKNNTRKRFHRITTEFMASSPGCWR